VLPERNGVGSFYNDLSYYLSEHFKKVTLISPYPLKDRHTFFSISMPGDPFQRIYIPKIFTLKNAIEKSNADIIVLPTPGFYGMVGLRQAQKQNIPICPVLHNDYNRMATIYWDDFRGKVVKSLGAWANSFFFKKGKLSLVMNDRMIDLAKDLGSVKVKTIGTPLAKIFCNRPIRKLKNNIENVLFAGRLAPEKGIGKILDAAQKHKNIKFVFAGDGPLQSRIIKSSTKYSNIFYKGWLSRNELIDMIDQCQIFVLPSRLETFGTAAFEAMSRGRIVIVSGEAGIANWPILSNAIINLDHFDSLADTISFLIDKTPDERNIISETAFKAATGLNKENIKSWVDVLVDINKNNSRVKQP